MPQAFEQAMAPVVHRVDGFTVEKDVKITGSESPVFRNNSLYERIDEACVICTRLIVPASV